MAAQNNYKIRVSVSQMKTYVTCQLAWWYAYGPLKDRPPPTASTLLGSKVHHIAEDYMENGTQPPESKAGRIFSAGIDKLPDPNSVEIEKNILIPLNEDARMLCRIDMMGKDKPYIGDHKTTKSIKWVKTATQLKHDIQLLTYAYAAYHEIKPEEVEVELIYYKTTGQYISMSVKALVSWKDIEENWQKLGPIASEMAAKVNDEEPTNCKPNTDACGDYGGCYHQDKCPFSPKNSKYLQKGFTKMFKSDRNVVADSQPILTSTNEEDMDTQKQKANKIRGLINQKHSVLPPQAPPEKESTDSLLEETTSLLAGLYTLYKQDPPASLVETLFNNQGLNARDRAAVIHKVQTQFGISNAPTQEVVEEVVEETTPTKESPQLKGSCTVEHQKEAGRKLRNYVKRFEPVAVSLEQAQAYAASVINANLTAKRWGRILEFSGLSYDVDPAVVFDGALKNQFESPDGEPMPHKTEEHTTTEVPEITEEPSEPEVTEAVENSSAIKAKLVVLVDCNPYAISGGLVDCVMRTSDFISPFMEQIEEETGKDFWLLNTNYFEGRNRLKAKLSAASYQGYFKDFSGIVIVNSTDYQAGLIVELLQKAGAYVITSSK